MKRAVSLILGLVLALTVSAADYSFAEEDKMQKTAQVEYEPAADVSKGEAEGSLRVTLTESDRDAEIFAYWGDSDGKALPDYTFLARVKTKGKTEVSIKIPANLTIPDGAKTILTVLSKGRDASEAFVTKLPENAEPVSREGLLYTVNVCSDLHIDPEIPLHTSHFKSLLSDIKAVTPDSKGVFVVGDASNHGYQEEFDLIDSTLAEFSGLPEFHWVIGNHDVSYGRDNPTFDKQLKLFNKFSGNKKLYFDFWENDTHFIFLALDATGHQIPLPEDELKWLKKTIAKDASPDKPIFVFCHEAIQDTVAGSAAAEKWWGISNGSELADILKEYPQAVFFSGHSHWILSSKNEMYGADFAMCSAFNTSSVGYLWTGYDIVTGEAEEGAEALYCEVYSDKVLVRGRDVVNGKWIAAAQYEVKLGSAEGGNQSADKGCGSVVKGGSAAALSLFAVLSTLILRKKERI